MAIDQDNHIIDPVTGFAKHVDTGHIIGLEQAPPLPTRREGEWPKWVTPHDSQIVRQKVEGAPDVVSTPGWADSHVNRADGSVTVLVANEDEEKRALGEYQKPGDMAVVADDATKRAVRADVERVKRERAEALAREGAAKHDAAVNEEAARRVAEKLEREKRDLEAAAELLKAQQARVAETVGGDVPVPIAKPYEPEPQTTEFPAPKDDPKATGTYEHVTAKPAAAPAVAPDRPTHREA